VWGRPVRAQIEPVRESLIADHVWIETEISLSSGCLRVVVNTFSLRNYWAGFDPRVRVSRLIKKEYGLPGAGIVESEGFDYDPLEESNNLFYEHHTNEELQSRLLYGARIAIWMEVWGELYLRNECGLHQIHSRRASAAVEASVLHRDGALRLYFKNFHGFLYSELLLFKFCGQ